MSNAKTPERLAIEAALEGKWGFIPTPGPWFSHFNRVTEDEEYESGRICNSSGTRGKTEAEEINNAYIAACNPEAMRALLSAHDAELTAKDAEIALKNAEISRLRKAGGRLAICAFNISQTADQVLPVRTAAILRSTCDQWDAALAQGASNDQTR